MNLTFSKKQASITHVNCSTPDSSQRQEQNVLLVFFEKLWRVWCVTGQCRGCDRAESDRGRVTGTGDCFDQDHDTRLGNQGPDYWVDLQPVFGAPRVTRVKTAQIGRDSLFLFGKKHTHTHACTLALEHAQTHSHKHACTPLHTHTRTQQRAHTLTHANRIHQKNNMKFMKSFIGWDFS